LGLTVLLTTFGLTAVASDVPHDWKLLYQNGTLNTRFKHYSVIADGVAGRAAEEFRGKPGPAFLGMKVWASSSEEAAHMFRLFAERTSFTIKGKVDVYDTEPSEPPRDEPHAYGIKFTSYRGRR
jgi:hypothetical protein